MSFFGYRSSSSRSSVQETHLSELERLRGRQLASLVRAGGRAKNQQQTIFEVPVADTPRGSLSLKLQLPSEFPVKVPQLQASIPVQHRWLDTAGNVQGHPDLNQWTAHSDLGRIVTEIVTELRAVVASSAFANKPSMSLARDISPASVASLSQYPGASASYTPLSRPSLQVQIQQPKQQSPPDTSKAQRSQMPEIPTIVPELEELSLLELEKLNSDKHALKRFVKELPSVKGFTQLRNEVLHSNMEIAKTTLGYESEQRELQTVIEAQRTKLRDAQQMLADKQARQQRIVTRHRPDALLEQLSVAIKDVENETDEVATQFIHGDINVVQFLSTYVPRRNLYHERTLKWTRTTKFPSACKMTWSWPVYTPVTWRSIESHPKYQLYRVDMQVPRGAFTGIPVLFVPGHMGSYKQARSLSRHLWDMNNELFDVFALDFHQEATGLNGNYITDQAFFLNHVIRGILREYKRQIQDASHSHVVIPKSVIIVAHSMGGIVARTAEFLPNYKKYSIQHVVALGVPYDIPSFPFDPEMRAVYDRMQSKRDIENDVVYVSIAGGHKDTLVQTSSTSVDTVTKPSRAFAVLASAIPAVKTPVDHFCLLWCHQLLKVVAQSLYKVVDLETRELLSSPSVRLAIAKEVLFGGEIAEEGVDSKTIANVSLHQSYVQDGYYPGEYIGYALLLPYSLTKLLRTRFVTVIVIMYALTLQIFYAQLAHWQTRFNLQSTSSPQDLSQDNFPSFTSMLHPAAHAPAYLKSALAFFSNSRFTIVSSKTTTAIAVLTLAMTAGAGYFGYGKLLSGEQSMEKVIVLATMVAEFMILYAYALGLLYAVVKFFSLLQRFVVSPVVSTLNNVTDRLKLRSWMLIIAIHGTTQLLGQIASSSSVNFSRILGLLVIVSFVIFVLYMLALGGNTDGTLDQQRMKRSLFAILLLSIFPWVGKVWYFIGIVRLPPSDLPNDLLMEGGSYILILSVSTYLVSLSLECMIPLPPTAFFGASLGQDAASVYGKSSSNSASNIKITAENCPKCIFEDGGPGAVLVEYNDRTTRRVVAGNTGEVVYVGLTFRVVSCDCVYRFKNSRDFCDFCIRSCRLCGGGNGNFQEAAKYKDFLKASKVDLAMHALVPMTFQICAAVQATYGLYRAHLSFYLTPPCVLALVIYHIVLRHPVEARRIKNKQRKKSTKKKKSSSKSKSKPVTTSCDASTTATTTINETTSRNKKKKKRKLGTSSTFAAQQ
ncbi:unnamed protein product [Peronospora farinosa]|nr:unnamed protein product [Peronospora farinosa]